MTVNTAVFEQAAEALWQAGRPALGEALSKAAAELIAERDRLTAVLYPTEVEAAEVQS